MLLFAEYSNSSLLYLFRNEVIVCQNNFIKKLSIVSLLPSYTDPTTNRDVSEHVVYLMMADAPGSETSQQLSRQVI